MTQKPVQDNRPVFAPDALSFIPLGGCGEFGCNLNVYQCEGKYLVIDCGLGFPDERFPGVDILLPNPGFLRECTKDIVGMFITHAHEDHIGAVAALWPQLQCPLYATPLTAELMKHKLNEWGLTKRVTLNVVPLSSKLELGPFKLELINAAHSVPETSMLFIRTAYGNVLHTADWRFDPNPVEGHKTDEKRLKELGKENILAVIGDSTNATVPEEHASESEVEPALTKVIQSATGRVIVTSFSSQVARIHNVAMAAKKAGRMVGIVGRSAVRMVEAAKNNGYLKDLPQFLTEQEINDLPRHRTVVFATGSQGEMGSALDRLATDEHRSLSMEKGDMVVFSARVIPGNEKAVERVKNALLRRSVHLVSSDDAFVHVSGHANAQEIKTLYTWLKPNAVIPVHGHDENLMAHAEIAREIGVPHTLVPTNGDIIAIRETGLEKTGQVLASLMAVDGARVVPLRDSLLLKERHRIANEGSIVATVVCDEEGYLIHDPVFSIVGLGVDEADQYEIEDVILRDIEESINKADPAERRDAERLRELIRLVIRRRVKQETGKRPLLSVHLVMLE
jgi:ribonuclease J